MSRQVASPISSSAARNATGRRSGCEQAVAQIVERQAAVARGQRLVHRAAHGAPFLADGQRPPPAVRARGPDRPAAATRSGARCCGAAVSAAFSAPGAAGSRPSAASRQTSPAPPVSSTLPRTARPDRRVGIRRECGPHRVSRAVRRHSRSASHAASRTIAATLVDRARRRPARSKRVARDRSLLDRRASARSAPTAAVCTAADPSWSALARASSARGSPSASSARSIPARARPVAAGNSCSRCSTARGPITVEPRDGRSRAASRPLRRAHRRAGRISAAGGPLNRHARNGIARAVGSSWKSTNGAAEASRADRSRECNRLPAANPRRSVY